tara:strand:- start:504 stop:929 length:426 start_codon:yes stop_codon:yes gene_type:complete
MTVTTTYGLNKPTIGASTGSWGNILNDDLDLLDDLLDGTVAISPNLLALKIAGTTITTSAEELNYADGVTSNIQTQLDTKAPSASPTLSGTITITGGTQSWTAVASGTDLTFSYNGINVMRVDSSGNLTVTGDVTAYGAVA